ncbi:MAG: TIGR01777 family oxidoreductase [Flavobacteriales bacterium]
MNKKIVIAGASGFIGTWFTKKFKEAGYEVLFISRQKNHIQWNDTNGIKLALENSEMVINLAGKSVNCRYNQKNKNEILRSRIETTQAIGNAINQCVHPPKLWLNSSTATIYRHAEDRPQTESTGEIGKGFSVDVATSWEKAFFDFKFLHTRQVALRISIVLGKDGGVIPVFARLVRFGLGGKQGNGKQMFSWIHIEDLFRIVQFIQTHTEIKGPVNCSTPNAVTNTELMKTFRKAMNKKIGLPAPVFLLKMGAVLIGTETELILKSRWVIPEKLVTAGFTFTFPTLDVALQEIFKK